MVEIYLAGVKITMPISMSYYLYNDYFNNIDYFNKFRPSDPSDPSDPLSTSIFNVYYIGMSSILWPFMLSNLFITYWKKKKIEEKKEEEKFGGGDRLF